MRLAVSVLALLSLATAASAAPACDHGRIADIAFTTEPGGLIDIPVSLDDRPIMLTVDTGAIHTVISSRVADDLQLAREQSVQGYQMVGGVPITQIAYSHSFKLGTLAAGRLGFMVAPYRALNIDTDGLFGPDVMSNYDVEIDYAHGRFALFVQDHCSAHVVTWTKGDFTRIPMKVDENWHISVPVTLDGKMVNAYIDTGAEHSLMTAAVARDVFNITATSPNVTKRDNVSINGTALRTILHYPFATLDLNGITMAKPEIDILPNEDFGKDGPQLVIGASVLRDLHLYIAYKDQVLYATPAEAK